MPPKKALFSFSILALSATTALPAHAQYPNVSGEIVVEIQNENTVDSDDSTTEHNNIFLRTEVAPTITLNENIFIDGVLVLEPFDQAATKNIDDDIFFQSNGLFAEEVKINFAHNDYAFWAGKFNPAFGTAWDARGIWGEDFAEDYEITEKFGVGASYSFITGEKSESTLSASTFFADTSFLSKSTLTSRPRTTLSDGGASNTEDLSSFAISLDSTNVAGIEDLNSHIAVRHLAQGDADIGAGFDDEKGMVLGLHYTIPVSEDMALENIVEYVTIENFEGIADRDHQYVTIGTKAIYQENWNVTFSYTARNIDEVGTIADFDDSLFQVSTGYDFNNGLTAEAGYKTTDEAGVNSNILGFLFRYTKEF